jgi:hypothetical protein
MQHAMLLWLLLLLLLLAAWQPQAAECSPIRGVGDVVRHVGGGLQHQVIFSNTVPHI